MINKTVIREWIKKILCNYIVKNGEEVPVNTFIGCDPATDIDTKHSDFSVITVIAIDANNELYVLEYERHRSVPTIGSKSPIHNVTTKIVEIKNEVEKIREQVQNIL